jgi:hypothetical protein
MGSWLVSNDRDVIEETALQPNGGTEPQTRTGSARSGCA